MSALTSTTEQAVVSQAIAAFVLHAVWQAPLLAGAAALAIRVGRPQARVAHVIWAATLLLCVLMPVCATVLARRAAVEAERNAAVSVTYVAADFDGPLPEMTRKPAWQRMLNRHFNRRDGMTPFAFTLPVRASRVLAALYLLIAFCLALRLMVAWRRSRRLVALSSKLPENSAVTVAFHRQCDALGVAVPPLRVSDAIAGPALAGVFRPTLLLPACAAEMSETEVEAVLAHELAHVRRHDPPVHMACSLLLVPVGFHPAALWVAMRVRQTREMACDAEAAGRMGSAARYARALLQVAERTGAGDERIADLGLFQSGLGLFNTGLGLELTGGAMEERMRMMMDGESSGSMAGRMVRWSACVLVGCVALVGAAMLQVQPAVAQQQQLPVVVEPKMDKPLTTTSVDDQDQPRLLGGAHAQEQLRKARRDLDVAASKATTDDERKKIATARAVIGAAQEQLADAGGGRAHVVMDLGDLKGMDEQVRMGLEGLQNLKIDPLTSVQIEDLKNLTVDPQIKVDIAREKANVEVMRAQIEKHRAEFEAMRAKVNSPEFQAQMRAQMEEAKKQMAAAKIDQAQIARMLKDTEQQRVQAMATVRSGELQRQMDAANSMIAHMEMPAGPDALKSFTIMTPEGQAADAGAQDKPLKVESGKMAGNKTGGNLPVYPPDAKAAHISGAVVLHALIDEAGKIESLQVVSSPDASLSKSAIDAVQTWTYKPYLLNGQPRSVDTTITVNFSFGG